MAEQFHVANRDGKESDFSPRAMQLHQLVIGYRHYWFRRRAIKADDICPRQCKLHSSIVVSLLSDKKILMLKKKNQETYSEFQSIIVLFTGRFPISEVKFWTLRIIRFKHVTLKYQFLWRVTRESSYYGETYMSNDIIL